MSGPPPLGWVRISSTDPPLSVTARLAADRPNVTAGYGGWSEVARPRRSPLSVWQGSPGLRIDLPIQLDGWTDGSSVEPDISSIERLATPGAADGAPPRLRFIARGAAVPHQSKTWVVDTLAWGDALMDITGNRTRQQVTLSLLEYIADVRVDKDSPSNAARHKAAAAKAKAGAARKRIIAAKKLKDAAFPKTSTSDPTFGSGEDLLSIAARELGDADRWVEIANLNGLRDPRAISAGQVIRLP